MLGYGLKYPTGFKDTDLGASDLTPVLLSELTDAAHAAPGG
jgi:hypothetical protein